MEITFLGTGSIIPNPNQPKKQSYSAILIEIGNDKLLFDIGPGTLTKLQSRGINTQLYPNYLFITHFHIDHCSDYIPLVKSRNFNERTSHIGKGKLINVFGPPGLKKWNTDIFHGVTHWSYMSRELNFKKITNCKEVKTGLVIKKKNWKVTCCQIEHYGGVAFRIDSHKKSFVYSGDMAYDERICALGKNADVVAIECSFPNKKTLRGKHLEPQMIGKLAKLGNFKTVIPIHMYPINYGKEKKIVETIKKISGSKVLLSHDFKKISL